MQNANLSNTAMLVRLSISQWTARKYDKKVSENVATQYMADKNAGRYNKVLVAEEAIKAIQKTANEARTYHYEQTLPWGDDDSRLLPAANYLHYSEKMRGLRVNFESAVADFIAAYPVLVDEAKARLNGMFNASDYPYQSEIARRYSFGVSINPLPSSDDFRVSLHDSEVLAIRADIAERTKQAQQTAMADLWSSLHTAVSHIADKLHDKDAIFRDSLIHNVVDICELLPRLNVLGDVNLENMRQAVEGKLCSYRPDDLRANKTERKNAANDAASILDAMSAYMGGE